MRKPINRWKKMDKNAILSIDCSCIRGGTRFTEGAFAALDTILDTDYAKML